MTAILSSDEYAVNITTNLESALENLKSYFNKWNIMINPEKKTKAIYFTKKRKSWFLPQNPLRFISWKNNVKYLGIILDPKLNKYIPYLLDKINKLIYIMYPLINGKRFLNIDNKKLVLKSIFHPLIFYCTPVWAISANYHLKTPNSPKQAL